MQKKSYKKKKKSPITVQWAYLQQIIISFRQHKIYIWTPLAASLKASQPKIMMIPPEGPLAKGVYFLIR